MISHTFAQAVAPAARFRFRVAAYDMNSKSNTANDAIERETVAA
jgi:hypothetical protein